jgi:transcriptional regulator with XRE-family HTH domain
MTGKIANMLLLRVKEVAESKGFNISTLSRKADVPFSTVRRAWRDPRYQIQLDTLYKLAQALGVSTSDLIEDVPED